MNGLIDNNDMPYTIEGLQWDSSFFNCNVCRINGSISNCKQLSEIFEELRKRDIDLAYYSSPISVDCTTDFSRFYLIKPVDKKVVYIKNASNYIPFNDCVTEFKHGYPDSSLIELALQSGIYSRFYIDNKIGKSKYEALYKEWIINSVNKTFAREVLVYSEKQKTVGFVTLGERNGNGEVGIISVDNNWRGKGIGKILMRSAERWFVNNNFRTIQVATQGKNLPARRLYESCGYNLYNEEYSYHIWKK